MPFDSSISSSLIHAFAHGVQIDESLFIRAEFAWIGFSCVVCMCIWRPLTGTPVPL